MMPPSPMKRKRREEIRQRALDMAQKGLNKRGGPVDQGTPDAQKRAAEPMQHAKREERNDQARRSFTLHRNATGNARSGQFFRTIKRSGGEVHDYAGTKNDVFVRKPAVKPESGGTGNHPGTVQAKRITDNVLKPVERAHKPASSTYDRMARDLAKRRATENMPNAKRKFASIARLSPDSGRAGRRRRRLVGIGVGSSGKRQYI